MPVLAFSRRPAVSPLSPAAGLGCPEEKPGLPLPFQQGTGLVLPLISAAFRVPAHPMAVPAQQVTNPWDIGLSCVPSVLQAAGLLLFAFGVT